MTAGIACRFYFSRPALASICFSRQLSAKRHIVIQPGIAIRAFVDRISEPSYATLWRQSQI
jgi:hypothetical protein